MDAWNHFTEVLADQDPYGLEPHEIFWRDNYHWFLEHGYKLPPRYHPDWVASWKGTNKYRVECPDGEFLKHAKINRATVVKDGTTVALKSVELTYTPHEETCLRYLCAAERISDPRNHTVPIIDILTPPDSPDMRILVMPALRDFMTPPFETVGEAIAFIDFLIEGVAYLHEHKIAHRDINFNNVMMDGRGMFPKGHNFVRDTRNVKGDGPAPYLSRTRGKPRYYITDLGNAIQYPPSVEDPKERVIVGGDRSCPEYKTPDILRNPFHTDVYCIGNLIREQLITGHPQLDFYPGYYGLEFLLPFIEDLTQEDPEKRPTMDEVVAQFKEVVAKLTLSDLRAPLVPRNAATRLKRLVGVLPYWMKRLYRTVLRVNPVPTPRPRLPIPPLEPTEG